MRQQEAYDWDRMVVLGRRKKGADHVESGQFNAGYVAEQAAPSKDRIEAPAHWTIGEAPGMPKLLSVLIRVIILGATV